MLAAAMAGALPMAAQNRELQEELEEALVVHFELMQQLQGCMQVGGVHVHARQGEKP